MTKFVYVSNDYRQAWSTYVVNVDDMWQPEVNIDELEFLLAEVKRLNKLITNNTEINEYQEL